MARPAKHTKTAAVKAVKDAAAEAKATAVKAQEKAQGLEASELKIYVNANEQAAYYTVDGQGGESYKVDLKAL